MAWYYANNNHRLGPVSDSEFARLAREKTIVDETLVWRHGMPDWKTYAEVVATLPPPELNAVPGEASAEPAAVTETVPAAATPVAPVEPAQVLAPRLAYAGFWIRLGAKLVDWLILFIISRQLIRLLGLEGLDPFVLMKSDPAAIAPVAHKLMWLGLLDGLVRLSFYWFFLKRFAATPGKWVFRLRVVRPDGGALSHGQVIGRFFSEVLTKYFTLGIGYVVAAFDDEKRTMHDHFSGTRVVIVEKKEKT